MSQRQRNWRCIGAAALAVVLSAPALQAGKAHTGAVAPHPAQISTFWSLASPVWRALFPFWSAPDHSASAARTAPRRHGRGHGLLPTCDEGVSLDPNGLCHTSVPTCDNGVSLDPDGRCAAH
jgi:hypothetical protein